MARTCIVLVAGLDAAMRSTAESLPILSSLTHRTTYRPVFPAVTCTAQATLTTGVTPDQHGILCNGLYTYDRPDLQSHLDLSNHADTRKQITFWEQANSLLQKPRFWDTPPLSGKKVSMLFWQNSMPGKGNTAADIVITPKPTHTPDGKTLTACWSKPAELYNDLVAKFGPFPLHNYWSPMAGIGSTTWIVNAALDVWNNHAPDLQLVYIPHLDFNLQRLGPSSEAIAKDLQAVDAALAPLAAKVRADGGTLIILGDYGVYDASVPIFPNRALRDAGLFITKPDANGKLLLDYAASTAIAMADHQVAYVYVKPEQKVTAVEALKKLEGIAAVLDTPEKIAESHLTNDRTALLVLVASRNAWFAHDWWHNDAEKPQWQFTVDIHNKPGFDPRELFFDPARKCIAQEAERVKGSHGRTDEPDRWPLLLSDAALPVATGMDNTLWAQDLAAWFKQLLMR